MKKTDVTSTRHILPFSNLSDKDFERLCYWVVEKSSNFDIVEHYGMTGDKKRDIIGYKHNKAGRPEQWYFQCKNYKKIYFAILRDELDAIKNYSDKDKDFKPDAIVFVTGCSVSSRCKDRVKEYAETLSLGSVYFWTNIELDEKAKAIKGVVEEFFGGGLSSDDIVKKIFEEIKPHLPLVLENLPSPKTNYFTGRKDKKKQIIDILRRGTHRILIAGFPGVGKTTLAIEIAHFCAREKNFEAIIWVTSEPERRLTLDRMLDVVAETLNRNFNHFEE